MTTLVYRDRVLVTDTQASKGDIVSGRAIKAVKRGPIIAAVCGDATFARAALDWVRHGCIGYPRLGHEQVNAGLALFMPDGLLVEFFHNGQETQRPEFWAEGSGAKLAMGAMAAGATADEAIRIASTYDVWTSGPFLRLTH